MIPTGGNVSHALRRQSQGELLRIPYVPDFHDFAKAGNRLAELHVVYEKQTRTALEQRGQPGFFPISIEPIRDHPRPSAVGCCVITRSSECLFLPA
ncbi:MAG TPA: type ISP restriction/modification enzyme [Terriglobales bacterium]|nr:type ISP restriction/modification enzyme [Terriglobales bacterium]